MKKFLMSMFSFLMTALFLAPASAFAQEAPAAPPEGFDLIPAIIEAAQGGRWNVFTAMIILALVWLVTKAPVLSDLIKGEAKVWVSASAGALLAVGVAIFTAMPDSVGEWLSTIFSGLVTGLAATGFWELVKRRIEGKAIDADGDGKLDA